jgi:hypothetical protein
LNERILKDDNKKYLEKHLTFQEKQKDEGQKYKIEKEEVHIQEMQKVLDVHKKLARDMMHNQINKDLNTQLKEKKILK